MLRSAQQDASTAGNYKMVLLLLMMNDDDDAAPCGLACVDRGDRGSEGGVVDGGGSGGVSSGSDGGDGCGCGVVVVMVKEKELVSPKAHPYGSNSLQQRLYPERR